MYEEVRDEMVISGRVQRKEFLFRSKRFKKWNGEGERRVEKRFVEDLE